MGGLALPPRLVRRGLDKGRREASRAAAQGIAEVRKGFGDARGYWQPQYDYGQKALSDFETWGQDPNAITSDPSYQWRLGQGQEALENSAIARGGMLSGNFAKDLTNYAQNAASQEYGNEFNRWMQKLLYGEDATSSMADLSANEGLALGRLYTGKGQNEFQNRLATAGAVGDAATRFQKILGSWMPSGAG